MPRFRDLTGMRFGRLTVISRAPSHMYPSGRPRSMWNCVCDCGSSLQVDVTCLTTGRTRSCGCLQRERTSEANKRHGMCKTRLYSIWKGIIDRTLNRNSRAYKWYGSRGITVWEGWLEFLPFMEWALANGYKDDLTIDRIDTNGDYEPNNCRWVNWYAQSRNTRKNRWLTYKGKQYCIGDLEKMLGFSKCGIYMRLRRGWSLERALCEPKSDKFSRRKHVETCK